MKHTTIRLTGAIPLFVFYPLTTVASAETRVSTLPPLAPNRLILDSAKHQGSVTQFDADDEELHANSTRMERRTMSPFMIMLASK
jgi:hypothetical protein